MSRPALLRMTLVTAALAAAIGCGKTERTVDIGSGGPVVDPVPVAPPGTSPIERVGGLPPRPAPADPTAPRASALDFTAPGEWQELPRSPMREAAFRVGGDPDAEASLSIGSGGVRPNVDRWREQIGLGPLGDAEFAALAKRPLLGGDAIYVELAGRYVGMGKQNVADAKLVGLVRDLPAAMVFVKMVGPAKVVDAEAERFRAFCASVRMPGTPAPTVEATKPVAPEATPPAPPATPEGTGSGGGLRWKWPAGWSALKSGSSMRAATIAVKDAPNTDLAVTVLSGDAGGLVSNLNRWRGQMGKSALSVAEIDALPRVTSLGTKAVVISIDGTYTSMQGSVTKDVTFLGAVIERESDVVFVRATGPTAEVAKLRRPFEAFLVSLEAAGDGK